MPDWTYRPLFRPVLFRLPAEKARDLTLWATGTLGKLPFGPFIIEAFGDMSPPAEIKRSVLGRAFASPVGLGAGLDTHALALSGLARLGLGFLEVGPVTREPVGSAAKVELRTAEEAIRYPVEPVNDGVEVLQRRLERVALRLPPLSIRLAHRPGVSAHEATRERCQMIGSLRRFAACFTLETQGPAANGQWSTEEWIDHLARLQQELAAEPPSCPLLLCLSPDLSLERAQALVSPAVGLGVGGVVVTGGIEDGPRGRLVGAPARAMSLQMVSALHRLWGDQLVIIGAGGVQEPADALRLLDAGAALVQVESGLVYAGPGLPKRINEAVVFVSAQARPGGGHRSHPETEASKRAPTRKETRLAPHETSSPGETGKDPARSGHERRGRVLAHVPVLFHLRWFWIAILGASMIAGGFIACLIAGTRVVLPYDEAFVGLTRTQLAAVNPRLLLFMAHDRVSLAGVMMSIGVLYWCLAVFGIRRGSRWAWIASCTSALVGFATFFLFLGFGYFDPLHAMVSVLLLGFFGLAWRGRATWQAHPPAADQHNDRAWRMSLWGQLVVVLLGVGILGAGVVIASIGITHVFVPEDLAFLATTAAALHHVNPHLVPLIAHDRAGMGGALVAAGVAVMLAALWGFRRGNRWLWWMLLGAGVAAIVPTLGVHLVIGYTNLFHLSPVLALLILFPSALALCWPYLCQRTLPRRGIARDRQQGGNQPAPIPLGARSTSREV